MPACGTCSCYQNLGFNIQMAFQPIVDIQAEKVYAYEALVRGEQGQGAGEVLAQITSDNMYSFDQTCRMTAIEQAAALALKSKLSINFMPNAIYEPETCLERTLRTAKKLSFPHQNIIFEVTEHEKIENHSLLVEVFDTYKKHGFLTAIDDFGEGYAGLNLLADFQPDLLKLDMNLIRNIHERRVNQIIVKGILAVACELDIKVIAEGIETPDEVSALKDLGIYLMQGYHFARPQLNALADPYPR
ncbi:diguanylate phosphodiesterase [Aliidiomarina haloalkalitolerans]|uniref:Diguanylate phosphodiesterase n=3 Tax=Gammaproteobacteria TaxID=1236 RepID=A0A432VT21_9GAMM|nr:diguanylate phosphodiesterase [Aliidiomarina haloalkalitolerans]